MLDTFETMPDAKTAAPTKSHTELVPDSQPLVSLPNYLNVWVVHMKSDFLNTEVEGEAVRLSLSWLLSLS